MEYKSVPNCINLFKKKGKEFFREFYQAIK